MRWTLRKIPTAYDKTQDARLKKLEAAVFGAAPAPAPTPTPIPPSPKAAWNFVLVNESTRCADSEVASWCSPLVTQAGHVDAAWHTGSVSVVTKKKESDVLPSEILIVVLDNADQAGALGYHDVSPSGHAYARVFAATCLDNGVSVSSCTSHEFVEILGDPLCDQWAQGPHSTQYARELGDPVESTSYKIGNVEVSDFVLPAYFELGSPATSKVSYCGWVGPFKIQRGGYQIVKDATGEHQVFGDAYPEWRLAGKTFAAARTAVRARTL